MHLGIDLRILDREGMALSGLGRYGLEMTRALREARPDWRLTAYTNRPQLLGPDLRVSARATRWPTAHALGRIAWLHAGSALEVRRDRPDAWFGPAFVLPVWWRGPSVVAIHDLMVMALPERYRGRLNARYATAAIRLAGWRADAILCGSASTKEEIVRHLGIDGEKVHVAPYGVAEAFFTDNISADETVLDAPYLLFVGTFEARKGLEVLEDAFSRMRPEVRLVLAGQPGWGTDAILERLHRNSRVRIELRPSDERLGQLMRGALALVYPSRMEGFGLPVAEAMATGCPVIASDLDCIREFADEVPLYAPVGDARMLAQHVARLLADTGEIERRRQAGGESAAGLRWSVAAETTACAIEQAVGGQ